MHNYGIIISPRYKKSACVTVLTLVLAHRKNQAKNFVENLHNAWLQPPLIRFTTIVTIFTTLFIMSNSGSLSLSMLETTFSQEIK